MVSSLRKCEKHLVKVEESSIFRHTKKKDFEFKQNVSRRNLCLNLGLFWVGGGGGRVLPAAVSVLFLMNGGQLQRRKVRR